MESQKKRSQYQSNDMETLRKENLRLKQLLEKEKEKRAEVESLLSDILGGETLDTPETKLFQKQAEPTQKQLGRTKAHQTRPIPSSPPSQKEFKSATFYDYVSSDDEDNKSESDKSGSDHKKTVGGNSISIVGYDGNDASCDASCDTEVLHRIPKTDQKPVFYRCQSQTLKGLRCKKRVAVSGEKPRTVVCSLHKRS